MKRARWNPAKAVVAAAVVVVSVAVAAAVNVVAAAAEIVAAVAEIAVAVVTNRNQIFKKAAQAIEPLFLCREGTALRLRRMHATGEEGDQPRQAFYFT